MRTSPLEFHLVHAAPENSHLDTSFTDRVMASLPSTKSVSSHIQNSAPTMWYCLRHLPKFTVILLAIATLFIVSTVTYAVVETIKQTTVKIEKSGTNEFGREQLSVIFDSCAEQKKNGTTYELKKDSGLSAEDGAKVLQAKCERDSIAAWIKKDPVLSPDTTRPTYDPLELRFSGFVGTIQSINESGISIHSTTAFTAEEQGTSLPFPKNTRVIKDGEAVDQKSLQLGDTVLYFSSSARRGLKLPTGAEQVAVFKLNLDTKYYNLDMESYVRVRSPCRGNPARTCLQSNHINMVTLMVVQSSNISSLSNEEDGKEVEGKVISWNASQIKLDVGKGIIYTIHTESNVIDTYNHSTVYGLKSFDNIYAKTDPEELKVRPGDSLQIGYSEKKSLSSPVIEWSQIGGIGLMVERRVDDISILRKY